MGIQGLSTFIDNNPQLLTDLRLHDTRVIIDGKNLFHFLYFYFDINAQCGGDYDTFAQRVRYYFTTLKVCNVHPYVILDGAYDASGVKLSTTIKRALDKLRIAESAVSGIRTNIIPILAQETFQCVLREMGIPEVTCDFEADREIASLAKAWNCPVMSNDSDFYIYDVPGGFILFDYLNLSIRHHTDKEHISKGKTERCDKEYTYISAQVFYLDSILKLYKCLDRKLLPLFATLHGNDYVHACEFEIFFSKAQLPKPDGKKHTFSKRHYRMKSVLLWFERKQLTFESAVKSVLSHYEPQEREDLRKRIELSVNTYLDLDTCLAEYFEGKEAGDSTVFTNSLRTAAGSSLPEWMVRGIRSGTVSTQCLNAMILQRVFLQAQVECPQWSSAQCVSLPLRQLIYALLFTLDMESAQENIEMITITEYDRFKKDLKKNEVEARFQYVDGENVPSLRTIASSGSSERLRIFLRLIDTRETVYTKLVEFVPMGLVLASVVAVFWARHADPPVTTIDMRVLLVGLIKLHVLDRSREAKEMEDLTGMTESDRCAAERKLVKFSKAEYFSKRHRIEIGIIHGFAQYQTCLVWAGILHQLCQAPLGRPNPAHLFNGSLIYNLGKEMKHRKNPALFTDELLGRGSSVQLFHAKLYETLSEGIPAGKWLPVQEKAVKTKRKQKKAASTPAQRGNRNETEQDSAESNSFDFDTVQASCQLKNKFSLLTIE